MSIPTIPRYITVPQVLRFAHNPIEALDQYTADYGHNYFLYIGGAVKSLVTSDPEVTRHVLQRNHRNYEKSPIQTKILGSYIGQGLLTNTGESWLRQRRLRWLFLFRDRMT